MFGPLVAVERALEVLGRLQRHHGHAVGDGEERHLGPVEVLLDHHPLARRVGDRLVEEDVTTTPLPAASPSCLTT